MSFRWSDGNCRVMGILNVTPDSFSDGNDYYDNDKAIARAIEMQFQGAEIIDIGAESTRPGSLSVSPKQQIERLLPIINELKTQLTIPISIDTTSTKVAEACFDAGAEIVNDTSAGTEDPSMLNWVASKECPVVLMHRSAKPVLMQEKTQYANVVDEVVDYLFERARVYESAGVDQKMICLDPGIGFGKKCDHNVSLTQHLKRLTDSPYAVLYGASRKSFIGELLNQKEPKRRDAASVAMATWAARQSVDWVRVHNVNDTKSALQIESILEKV